MYIKTRRRCLRVAFIVWGSISLIILVTQKCLNVQNSLLRLYIEGMHIFCNVAKALGRVCYPLWAGVTCAAAVALCRSFTPGINVTWGMPQKCLSPSLLVVCSSSILTPDPTNVAISKGNIIVTIIMSPNIDLLIRMMIRRHFDIVKYVLLETHIGMFAKM